MNAAARPIATLTEESEHNLEVLRRSMRRAADFRLFVVLAGDAARFEVLRRLRTWSESGAVPALHFFPEGEEGAQAVDRFLAVADRAHPFAGAVIPDGNALLDAGNGEVIASLNMARDILGKLIRGPLVLIISAEREAELAGRAIDLFDVRAGTIAVEGRPVELPANAATELLTLPEPGKTEKARSLIELQTEAARLRAIEAADEPPPSGALADAWLRLGQEFLARADRGEARASATEAKRLAEGVGYTRGIAEALVLETLILKQTGHIEDRKRILRRALDLHRAAGDRAGIAKDLFLLGDALLDAGRLDEAEETLHEARDIFEQLSAKRERAVTLGRIADIFQMRGQLDEALRIRQQEVLPVFEQIGDIRSRAVTLGQIADIFQDRGQLDEALRIKRQEEFPVYERIGDIRSRLICQANMAIFHLKRGAPGDREAAAALLRAALADAERMQIPEAEKIRQIQREAGLEG